MAVAVLGGCGGSQPPIGTSGSTLQNARIETRGEHGRSWMLPEAKSEDLLYADVSAESKSTTKISSPGALFGVTVSLARHNLTVSSDDNPTANALMLKVLDHIYVVSPVPHPPLPTTSP